MRVNIGKTGVLSSQLKWLEDWKRKLGEQAAPLPSLPEDYRKLRPDERLRVARDIMELYADLRRDGRKAGDRISKVVPGQNHCVATTLGTNHAGIFIDARIGYDVLRKTDDYIKYDYIPAIEVWTSMRDAINGQESRCREDTQYVVATFFNYLGRVEFRDNNPRIYVYDSNEATEWPDYKDKDMIKQPFNTVDSRQLVEVIDEASCELITNVVAVNQRLGNLATETHKPEINS